DGSCDDPAVRGSNPDGHWREEDHVEQNQRPHLGSAFPPRYALTSTSVGSVARRLRCVKIFSTLGMVVASSESATSECLSRTSARSDFRIDVIAAGRSMWNVLTSRSTTGTSGRLI